MAQHDYDIANQSFPSFRSDLNSVLEAINTSNSGTSRPSSAVAGTIWLDSTNATSPTLKFFDGSDDISLATLDYTANTVNWLDSTVTISSLSQDLDVNGNSIISSANGNITITPDGTGKVIVDGLSYPTADGTNGQALITDGSGNLSFGDVAGGTNWQSSIVTGTTLSAVAGNGYWIDTTSNACTVTLPASASVGDTIEFSDYARTWGTNSITINQNSLNFQGYSSPNPEYNTNGQSVRIVYSGATQGWIPTSDDDVTLETPQFGGTTSFLVLAGGGGGGHDQGGGGGAGGYRSSYNSESSGGGGSAESSLTLSQGTTYTITVGASGSGATSGALEGSDGGDSSISGSDITTITSIGGGGGAGNSSGANGRSGGSGGGACGGSGTAGSGTANQGFDGGVRFNDATSTDTGGGGGAGQVGSTPRNTGGDGVASTITGSSVTRGGGGGGMDYFANHDSSGGAGGGGNGGTSSPVSGSTSGTANTGGGGGGGSGGSPAEGGNGGSGVVILRVLTSEYSGTTTGSPTVDTDGTDTILTFNASGSYTP